MTQTHLPFPTGDQLKERGTKKVLERNQDFRLAFTLQAEWLLAMNGSVTSEEITDRLIISPTHPNAIGAAMRSFAKQHKLVVTGYRKATRASAHSRTLAVWGRRA